MSIGAQMPPPSRRGRSGSGSTNQEQELYSQLEKSRKEYEAMKQQKERVERAKQQQHLEATIEMRETIELLKDESMMKTELISKFERDQKKTEDEVSALTIIISMLYL